MASLCIWTLGHDIVHAIYGYNSDAVPLERYGSGSFREKTSSHSFIAIHSCMGRNSSLGHCP